LYVCVTSSSLSRNLLRRTDFEPSGAK